MSKGLELLFNKKPDYICPSNTESELVKHLYSSAHLSPRIIACKLGRKESEILAILKANGVVDE